MKKTYVKPQMITKIKSAACDGGCGHYTKACCGPVNFANN